MPQKLFLVRERDTLPFSPSAVGDALHARRVSDRLTKIALATDLRVTEGSIRHWERGGMPVTAARILSYAFEAPGSEELWRMRALAAESALRRITETMASYRGDIRTEFGRQM